MPACGRRSSVMSSGWSSFRSRPCRDRARSSTRRSRGSRPPEEGRSPRSSSRSSPTPSTSSPRSGTTTTDDSRARSSKLAGSPCTRARSRRLSAAASRGRRGGRAHDRHDRPQAPSTRPRRGAALARARALRRRVLLRRGRRRAAPARRARVLVATARELSTLRQGSVELDALVLEREGRGRALPDRDSSIRSRGSS